MAITLSAATVPANADAGTVIGLFNTDNLKLQLNPFGWFVIVGRMLCATWTGQAVPGPQTIQVAQPGGPPFSLTITITAPAVAAVPISISLSPPSVSLADNAAAATKLASATVKMSDGSAFAGVLSVAPGGLVSPVALDLVLTRSLTAADDGSQSVTVAATQSAVTVTAPLTLAITPSLALSPDGSTSSAPNGPALVSPDGKWTWGPAAANRSGEYSVLLNGTANPGVGSMMEVANGGKLYVQIKSGSWYLWASNAFSPSAPPDKAPPPTVTSIAVNPASPVLPDTTPAGATVSTAAVTMSDGSKYGGTLTLTPTSTLFAVSGMTIVTGRGVAASDDGAHAMTVSAGGKSVALNVTVSAPFTPKPVITVDPPAPSITDTTPLGATVATYSVAMSDGSPFTGTVQFGPPNGDGGGIFALANAASKAGVTTGQIVVNPKGPGVGPNMTTVTDHITIAAVS